jgi:glycosyltransferase involved in cell wall biosynthesis
LKISISELNNKYLFIQKKFNLSFANNIKSKIRIGIFCFGIKNGGVERLVALLINYLYKVKIFKLYLFTLIKESNEYPIQDRITRVIVKNNTKNLIKNINKNKIEILIYNLYNYEEMKILNNLTEFKVIFYNHSCLFFWFYTHLYQIMSNIYNAYKNAKYIISLIPFENDYLFPKWGINSILMNNFMSYEYNEIVPSNLSSKIILMIGRSGDKYKRFELGIQAMKYIVNSIPECKMKMISNKNGLEDIINITKKLELQDNIEFVGYTGKPEIYYSNASLHIFPSICECFPMVLSETKIYGIPNIVLGLDYLSVIKGGTIIIYDDKPYSIAKESIKILKNDKLRKKLGNEARESIKRFNNKLTLYKWIKLILSIINGEKYYHTFRNYDKKIEKDTALKLINNQIKLLKNRETYYHNLTLNDSVNITFIENLQFVNAI